MTEELGKALALMQHLEEPYFYINNPEDKSEKIYYRGKFITIAREYFNYLETLNIDLIEYSLEPRDSFYQYLNMNVERIEEYDENNSDYLVLTDEEADDAWEDSLDSYIEECLEIPEWIRPYFDEDAWKSDARYDCRGHSLSSYDGEEYEEYIEELNTYFYIYRIN